MFLDEKTYTNIEITRAFLVEVHFGTLEIGSYNFPKGEAE